MSAEILGIIAPTFLCAAVGLGWSRFGPGYDRALITALVMNVGAPCLVFSRLVEIDASGGVLAQIAGVSLLSLVCFTAIGAALLRLVRLPLNTYLSPLVFGNTGNMGLPLCLFALGPEGLALGVAFFAITAVTQFTLGVAVWSGRATPGALLTTPLSVAALLAVGCRTFEVAVPGFVLDTTGLLAGLTIPLMLITLGVAIGEMQVSKLRRTLALSAFRLGMGAAVGFGLAWALGLDGVTRGVVIIQCAMPAAVFNALMAERYGRAPDEIASIVVLSTLLAFLMLPLLLAYAL